MIAPSWQETLGRLHSADTVGELWAVLIGWHGFRSTAQWDEPYALFCRFHEHDRDGAVITAALLCTDHRWRRAAHRLIEHLAGSGLLDGPDLDQLADWFLGEELLVAVPVESTDRDELAVARSVWPPLRRWAAQHIVRRTPDRWSDLSELARSIRAVDGAAIAAGVMDAADHLPRHDAKAAVAMGVVWGSGTVRLAALDAFADLHGLDAARALAAGDRSARVRAWADDHDNPPPPTDVTADTEAVVPNASASEQATLF